VFILTLTPGTEIVSAFSGRTGLWQALGNLVLFAPVAALLPLRVVRLRSQTQRAVVIGTRGDRARSLRTGRVSAIDDVILNTAGTLLGR
jgi:glycopeptide antibiotics resistance protein